MTIAKRMQTSGAEEHLSSSEALVRMTPVELAEAQRECRLWRERAQAYCQRRLFVQDGRGPPRLDAERAASLLQR